MHKPVVYVETSVISYLTAQPSRDPIVAERQQVTKTWWARRDEASLVTSSIVIAELRRGNRIQSKKRLRIANRIAQVPFELARVNEVADRLISGGSLPAVARLDALHVAVATFHKADYLVTWNLKHLANPIVRARAEKLIRSLGLESAIIMTPEELLRSMP